MANFTINVEKSHFCLEEVKYLCPLIGNGTISTDPDKITAITNFPVLRSIKQVRRFLGLTGWYHKFNRNYAAPAAPLTDTLKHKRSFNWSIHSDAINTGVGAVLMQNNDKGDEVQVAVMSKMLNKYQRNYTVTEKECLAAVFAVKKFRAYIEGQDFSIITDQAS